MASYYDIVNQAIEATVITDEEMGTSYLEPRYRSVLSDNNIHLPGYALPGDAKDQELWEILKLEVEKRNAKSNVFHALAEWIYQILVQTVDPALVTEENELMQNLVEYMKLNQEMKDKEKQLNEREEKIEAKEKARHNQLAGLSFAKKKVN